MILGCYMPPNPLALRRCSSTPLRRPTNCYSRHRRSQSSLPPSSSPRNRSTSRRSTWGDFAALPLCTAACTLPCCRRRRRLRACYRRKDLACLPASRLASGGLAAAAVVLGGTALATLLPTMARAHSRGKQCRNSLATGTPQQTQHVARTGRATSSLLYRQTARLQLYESSE